MTGTPCPYCGYFHAEDYSDVRNGAHEWIEGICMGKKAELRREQHQARVATIEVQHQKQQEADAKPGPGVAEIAAFHQAVAGGPGALNRRAETGAITQPDPRPLPLVLHVRFKRIHGYAGQPKQAYRWDAGFDLEICEPAVLNPGEWQNLHTGIVPAIPEGFWGHILARSSTWRNRGIRIEPAVIDASYRGELLVYAVNTRKEPQEVKVGERLAQIIVVPLPNVEWLEQMNLPAGERGERGYGSSGGQG